MKVFSWNVNGLRACIRKGFEDWLHSSDAAVVGLQEVRARKEQLPKRLLQHDDWHHHIVAAEKKGYSGVGLLSRLEPDERLESVGVARFDEEGRVQMARFGELLIANVYFPNGSGKNRDLSRIPYKLDFYDHLRDMLQPRIDAGERVLVLGDFNTAHREIDLARPRQNVETSGFRPEERESLDTWFEGGWVDSFRHFNDEPDHYTWWSYRKGVRQRNVGWRIDYILASPAASEFLRAAQIHPKVMGSDHCPLSVTLDPDILG